MNVLKKIFAPKSPAPVNAEEYYESGRSKALSRDYRGAIDDLNKALILNGAHVNALLERGKARAELKEFKGAIADYTKVISLQPKNANAYQKRAKAKNFLRDYTGAMHDLEMAVRLDPKFAIAYYERGMISLVGLKDKKHARIDFERAAELGFMVANDALRQLYSE
ncbi:MAG: tetratricopeptide repeat protein [Bacteroidota bacterium]